MKTYKIASNMAPILWHRLDGLYAGPGPGWIKVPEDTKITQLIWTKEHKSVVSKNEKPKTWKIKSESSKKVYEVTKLGNKFTCTCPGYTFRRFCKHTMKMKKVN